MINIFDNNAFGVVELTGAINDLAYVPGRIAELGLFGAPKGQRTTTASFEVKGSQLILVEPTPRGGPGVAAGGRAGRTMVPINIPHFEINDFIMADSVQGVRAFGEEDELETVMGVVAEQLGDHTQSMSATTEYSQLGAVKGLITYAGGTTLDLFQTFGVEQLGEVDFDLDNAGAADGALRKKCAGVIRTISQQLGGLPWAGKARAFVGDDFFDDVLGHKEVRETYKGWTEAQILREGYIEGNGKSYGAFEFGGIIFENYKGAVGDTQFVDGAKAHIFPEGVPGLFRTVHAPADYEETVNTVGKRLYAKQYPTPNGKGRHLDVQMNELNVCTRPKTLIKAKRT